jgi:hypothetical protein
MWSDFVDESVMALVQWVKINVAIELFCVVVYMKSRTLQHVCIFMKLPN